ncbi:hypothetical protein JCM16303_004649 [Sporobolomyces ruberrimus]
MSLPVYGSNDSEDNSAPPRAPTLALLPPELWLQILLKLDYVQLKRASRICKTFWGYIMGNDFDAILFRQGVPEHPHKTEVELEVHPMLHAVGEIYPDRPTLIVAEAEDILYFPNDYPAVLNEFATAPASASIEFFSVALFNAPGGVTVGDVLNNFPSPESWERQTPYPLITSTGSG